MLQRSLSQLFALLLLFSCASLIAQQSLVTLLDGSTISPAQIDQAVTRAMEAAHVAGVGIAVFNHGQVAYLKAYGLKGRAEASTADTRFRDDRRGATNQPERRLMLGPQVQITSKREFPTLPTSANQAIRLSCELDWRLYSTKYDEAFFQEAMTRAGRTIWCVSIGRSPAC